MIAHWDEVEAHRRDRGHLCGRWTDLGRAAGSVAVGLRRIQLDPGDWSTPAHVHGREEEIVFVLGGSGVSWEDGETYALAGGDCVVRPPNRRAHTLRAGADGLDVLVFGERRGDEAAYLPRAEVLWLGHHYVLAGPADRRPWDFEADAGPPPLPPQQSPRPHTIVHLDEVDPQPSAGAPAGYERERRRLTRGRGLRRTGLTHLRVHAGALSAPHHCHGAGEELFVVLEGEATLELVPSPQSDDTATEIPLRPGHVVSRPAGTGLAHAFRAGSGGFAMLAYGQNDPNEIVYYPRSNKVSFAGVGLIARVEPLDYWDGEEDP